MTAAAGHDKSFARFFVSTGTNLLVLSPSLATVLGLFNGALPVQSALQISYMILFLASVNVAMAIMLEPYRQHFSKFSLPAIVSMTAVVLFFIVNQSLKLYFPQISYDWLIPLVVASVVLIYITVMKERNVPLKCLLSLDSIALMFLWSLSAADKFTVPF